MNVLVKISQKNPANVFITHLDVYIFMGVKDEQEEYFYPLVIALSVAILVTSVLTAWQVREIMEMKFVANNGYSKKWKSSDRLVGTTSGEDPRVKRDMEDREKRIQQISMILAITCDVPWCSITVWNGTFHKLNTFGILSVLSGGLGLGLNFANILELVKRIGKKKVVLYTVVPAEIKIGVGSNFINDPEKAMEDAYENAMGEIGEGRDPNLLLIFMTANVDHERALKRLNEITEGKIPYSGCTICQGAMEGGFWRQTDELKLTSIWAIHDPEGSYELGMADLSNASDKNPARKIVQNSVTNAEARYKIAAQENPDNPVIQGDPNFIWINPPPGPEDEVLLGVQDGMGGKNVEVIGGSSADNDVSGSWKQWNSEVGVVSNGVSFVISRCSAQLKGLAFTGYSATPKTGTVTKTNGPRHIITIDDKPAGQLYDDWTSGHFKDLWSDPEDSNILGPSSVYPLGQVVGRDWDNEEVYRTLHPHLLVKSDKSMTVFSDVHEGQQICMMTGTKENIQTKISAVASNVLRSTGIPTSELRGALVVFCAGAMMYVGKDGMNAACGKLDTALGGVNYLGIHTFGEQGPFPDGTNKHGNLMFSALVFSSRRKIMLLSNVETEEFVLETDPKFREIALSGGIIGRNN